MTNRYFPILTQDGLTAVDQAHHWNRSKVRPEEYLQFIEGTVRVNTLTNFADIRLVAEPEPWEFWYIRPNCTYEQWRATREKYVGCTTICGNLEELSYAFRFHTKDHNVIARFTEAFESNPAWPKVVAHNEAVKADLLDRKRVYAAAVAKGAIHAVDA